MNTHKDRVKAHCGRLIAMDARNQTKGRVMDTKAEFKQFRDASDPWGSSIGLLFQIAAELWWRGECPGHWDYSPSMASDPREPDDWYFDLIERETTDDLVAFGDVLERHVRLMVYLGHSY